MAQFVVPANLQQGDVFTFQVNIENIKKDLGKNTLVILKTLARSMRLRGYSKMKKAELVEMLKQALIFQPTIGIRIIEQTMEDVVYMYNQACNQYPQDNLGEIEMNMILELEEEQQKEVKKLLIEITEKLKKGEDIEELIEKLDEYALN